MKARRLARRRTYQDLVQENQIQDQLALAKAIGLAGPEEDENEEADRAADNRRAVGGR